MSTTSASHSEGIAVAPAARADPAVVFQDPSAAALAAAIADGDDERLASLLPTVDLAVGGELGLTLLQWTLLHHNRRALQALLQVGADPAQPGRDGETVLHMAAMADDPMWLSNLLAYGASPDTRHAVTGATLLHAALRADRDDQFQRLLAAGADPGLADQEGNTPLHVAGLIAAPRQALALLAAGADPTARNRMGRTFRHYLFMASPERMSHDAQAEWQRVLSWLQANGIPLEDG